MLGLASPALALRLVVLLSATLQVLATPLVLQPPALRWDLVLLDSSLALVLLVLPLLLLLPPSLPLLPVLPPPLLLLLLRLRKLRDLSDLAPRSVHLLGLLVVLAPSRARLCPHNHPHLLLHPHPHPLPSPRLCFLHQPQLRPVLPLPLRLPLHQVLWQRAGPALAPLLLSPSTLQVRVRLPPARSPRVEGQASAPRPRLPPTCPPPPPPACPEQRPPPPRPPHGRLEQVRRRPRLPPTCHPPTPALLPPHPQ